MGLSTSDLDIDIGSPKTVEELTAKLNRVLQNFLILLQTQPKFLIRVDPNQGLPEGTPFGTIIFDVDENSDLQIGIWNGETIVYKT